MVGSLLRYCLTSANSANRSPRMTRDRVRFGDLLGIFPVHHFELNNDTSPTATLNANIKATSSFEPHFVWIDTGVGQLV
jgi:hypothetical protein